MSYKIAWCWGRFVMEIRIPPRSNGFPWGKELAVRFEKPIIGERSLQIGVLPKLEEYGRYMTLCIAALCVPEKKIITVSDFMLSGQNAIESRGRKVCRIGNTGKWISMFAGLPSHAKTILTSVNEQLDASGSEGGKDLVNAFSASYQYALQSQIGAAILSPFGLGLSEFRKDGPVNFGQLEFGKIIDAIKSFSLGTTFLVAGFAPNSAHIFSVENPGIPTVHDQEAFCAIGCGASLANSVLMRTFDPMVSANEIIYRLAEAKFCSEIVLGVGKRTYINVLGEDGGIQRIPPGKIAPLRQLWEKRCEVPSESNLMINELLEEED